MFVDPALSMALLGRQDFKHMHFQNNNSWWVCSNGSYLPARAGRVCGIEGNYVRHFHGTTLWQANLILAEGFRVGLYHKGSLSSPCGIWGCTRRGDCFDRTDLGRGWSRQAGEVALSGWDCPVVLCMMVPEHELKKHATLANGTQVRCWSHTTLSCGASCRFVPGTLVDIVGAYCEIHICVEVYKRFRTLNEKWQQLQQCGFVLCRAARYNPQPVAQDNLDL